MPVTVKFQIDVLVCGLQGRLFPSFDVGPMFPCSQNVMHCRKEVYATCLSKESIPAILPCKDIQLMKTSEVGKVGLLSCESSSNIAIVDV